MTFVVSPGFRVRDLPLRDDGDGSLPLPDDSFFDIIEGDFERIDDCDFKGTLIDGGAVDLGLELPR
jgi:hypothetical protein